MYRLYSDAIKTISGPTPGISWKTPASQRAVNEYATHLKEATLSFVPPKDVTSASAMNATTKTATISSTNVNTALAEAMMIDRWPKISASANWHTGPMMASGTT